MCKNSHYYMLGVLLISLVLSCQTGPDPNAVVFENKSPGVIITRTDDNNTTHIRVFIDGEQVKLYGEHPVKDYFDIKETSGCLLPNARHTIYFDAYYRFDRGTIVDKTDIIPLNINNDRHFFDIKWDSNRKKLVYTVKETVKIAGGGENSSSANPLDKPILNSFDKITASLPENAKIALLDITSAKASESEYVSEELSVLLVNSGKNVVERSTVLNAIRQEQEFQMTGEVDDKSAVSIGDFLGADIVITGSISGEDEFKRLRLKALDVKTARIIANSSESLE